MDMCTRKKPENTNKTLKTDSNGNTVRNKMSPSDPLWQSHFVADNRLKVPLFHESEKIQENSIIDKMNILNTQYFHGKPEVENLSQCCQDEDKRSRLQQQMKIQRENYAKQNFFFPTTYQDNCHDSCSYEKTKQTQPISESSKRDVPMLFNRNANKKQTVAELEDKLSIGYINIIPKLMSNGRVDGKCDHLSYESLPETYSSINMFLSETSLHGVFDSCSHSMNI